MPDEPSKNIRIDNFVDIAQHLHQCTSQELLTEIRIDIAETKKDIIGLSVTIEEINSSLNSFIEGQESRNSQLTSILQKHAEMIMSHESKCPQGEEWVRIWKKVEMLENEYHRRSGRGLWEDRIYSIIQAIMIAAAVALVLWFMRGGSIV